MEGEEQNLESAILQASLNADRVDISKRLDYAMTIDNVDMARSELVTAFNSGGDNAVGQHMIFAHSYSLNRSFLPETSR